MKVIFEHLDKTTLVTSAYQVIGDMIEVKTGKKVNPLTEEQISSIDESNTIDNINNVHLGLRFGGNYVEFDDDLKGIYMNILFKMKTTNRYFIDKIKEDFIVEFMYNDYLKEIQVIEQNIDECKFILSRILKQAMLIQNELKKFPNDFDKFLKPYDNLKTSKDMIDRDIELLLTLREAKIKDVFELEGYPTEEKRLSYDE